jgi:membrane protease subunit HflK
MIEESNGYLAQVIAEAEGESQRFESLLAEYQKAPEVTRQRLYLDAIQDVMSNSSKVLVDVEGGNNMLYLPLDKIIQQGSSRSQSSLSNGGDVNSVVDEVINKLRSESSSTARPRGVR